ncbi:MAG: hypothetical protein R8N23_04515 [Reichenbachiella sp.]|uniref:hypothetical protein n=1 Tax=Reichenbachiella sp. TaxID=2184521 RepID=UPI00296740E2|nr:hypothetical protein [Reichenbachiella sp.]MDW3209105.1 hypothetical protein [Reichenbachiella sp.]
MTDELNSKAAELISLLEKSKERRNKKSSAIDENLKGTSLIMDLGEVQDFKTFNTDGYGNKVSAFASLKEGYIGLTPTNYVRLQELVIQALENKQINQKADYEFIETEIFNWLILCYQEKRIKRDLVTYLEDRIDENCKEYIFYFKVLALAIEEAFDIGDVEISHLSEDKIQNELESLKEIKDDTEELDSFFNEFKEPVLARTLSYGVETKAKKTAMLQAELSINGLKCFFTNESLTQSFQIFDVDFNFNTNDFSSFIYETTEKKFSFQSSFNRTQGGHPIIIKKDKLVEIKKGGLSRFSNFINKPKNGSLYEEIIHGINHLGRVTSTRNLHHRVVELISFFERFIVPKDNSKAYGQKRLKDNLLPKIPYIQDDIEDYRKYVNTFYRIRDKYLHNKIELPINLHDLFYFQRLGTLVLIYCMELNKQLNEFDDLLEHFGIKGANK